jgi:hypothetical protein
MSEQEPNAYGDSPVRFWLVVLQQLPSFSENEWQRLSNLHKL